MTWRDKYGWPVELFIGRPFTNFVRILLHGDIWKTLRPKRENNANTR